MKWTLATIDKFIIATLTIVLLLAYPTWASLVNSFTAPLENVATQATESPSRAIASLSRNLTVEPKSTYEKTLDLFCSDSAADVSLKVQVDYLQFNGNNCWKNKEANAIEIENISNGYSATVFQQLSGKYKTDLIQLRPGLNEIKVRFRAVTGQMTEQSINVHSN